MTQTLTTPDEITVRLPHEPGEAIIEVTIKGLSVLDKQIETFKRVAAMCELLAERSRGKQ